MDRFFILYYMDKTALCKVLERFGELSVRHNQIKILTDDILDAERLAKLDTVCAELAPCGAVVRHDNPGFSRLGYVMVNSFSICVKPWKAQGKRSPGIKNESNLLNKINSFLKDRKYVNLVFESDKTASEYICLGVIGAKTNYGAGNAKSKPDIILDTIDGLHHLSIKQKDAEKWHSVDSTHYQIAKDAMGREMNSCSLTMAPVLDPNGCPIHIKNDPTKPVMRLSGEIAIPLEEQEWRGVMFANNIDAILLQTFKSKHFSEIDNTLYIQCDRIYMGINKVEYKDEPVLLVRNDPSRNCAGLGIAGIRIEAVMRSRINKNAANKII